MSGLSIRTRLIFLVGLLTVAMLAVGGMGFYIATSEDAEMESNYKHQTIPMREVARIRRLVVENSGQI